MIAAEAEMTEQDGATGARAGGETQGHSTRCGEPVKTLFSGAATLIQPCSQAGSEPDPALLPACGEPDPALFFGRSNSPPPAPTRWT